MNATMLTSSKRASWFKTAVVLLSLLLSVVFFIITSYISIRVSVAEHIDVGKCFSTLLNLQLAISAIAAPLVVFASSLASLENTDDKIGYALIVSESRAKLLLVFQLAVTLEIALSTITNQNTAKFIFDFGLFAGGIGFLARSFIETLRILGSENVRNTLKHIYLQKVVKTNYAYVLLCINGAKIISVFSKKHFEAWSTQYRITPDLEETIVNLQECIRKRGFRRNDHINSEQGIAQLNTIAKCAIHYEYNGIMFKYINSNSYFISYKHIVYAKVISVYEELLQELNRTFDIELLRLLLCGVLELVTDAIYTNNKYMCKEALRVFANSYKLFARGQRNRRSDVIQLILPMLSDSIMTDHVENMIADNHENNRNTDALVDNGISVIDTYAELLRESMLNYAHADIEAIVSKLETVCEYSDIGECDSLRQYAKAVHFTAVCSNIYRGVQELEFLQALRAADITISIEILDVAAMHIEHNSNVYRRLFMGILENGISMYKTHLKSLLYDTYIIVKCKEYANGNIGEHELRVSISQTLHRIVENAGNRDNYTRIERIGFHRAAVVHGLGMSTDNYGLGKKDEYQRAYAILKKCIEEQE